VIAEGETKARLVQDAYRQANGEGVFRKGESDFISGIIDSEPTKFLNAWRTDPKFKAAIDSAKLDLNSTLGKYGINNEEQKVQSQPTNQEQQARAWAKANPKDPRAAKILKKLGGK
jgi:hypothetical protein